MSVPTNRGANGSAGLYATSRRGGVTLNDVEVARSAIGSRATPAMIARFLGRCIEDVLAVTDAGDKMRSESVIHRARLDEQKRTEDLFAKLWREGAPISLITEQTGIPKGSFGALKEKLGLASRFSTSRGSKSWGVTSCGRPAEIIAKRIAGEYGYSLDDIRSFRRNPALILARRHVCAALIEAKYSYSGVGAFLHRHHTSVLDAVQRHVASLADKQDMAA